MHRAVSVPSKSLVLEGSLGVKSQAGNRWAGLGERVLWRFTPTPTHPTPPSLTVWRGEMELWIWGRVLEAGLRRGRLRLGSLEAGFGELAPRGAGLPRPRALQFGLQAPQSPQFPPDWWPCGESGWSLGCSDLAQGLPRLTLSVRPRRSGQRGHGTFSGHRRLGDHPLSEFPRPQQRRRRPAIEEVGQTWAGPQPGGRQTNAIGSFRCLPWRGPDPPPQRPANPRLRAADMPAADSPIPRLCRDSPCSRGRAKQVPCRRGTLSLLTPAPPPPLRRTERARCGDARIAPCAAPRGIGAPALGLGPFPAHPGLRVPHPAAASCGPQPRGSARAQRAAARSEGAARKEQVRAGRRGVFPAPHRRGRGRRGVR